jgi:hypothetical protein
MSDDLQPWIDLSTKDEKEWIQARYDGALPPGIASYRWDPKAGLSEPVEPQHQATGNG